MSGAEKVVLGGGGVSHVLRVKAGAPAAAEPAEELTIVSGPAEAAKGIRTVSLREKAAEETAPDAAG